MSKRYMESGVDIDAGNEFVERIKPHIKSTYRRGVVGDIGGFAGFFAPDVSDMKEPILVSGTDGVGTKLRLAIDMDKLDTIGIDLVAMCVNDVACCGAAPLFFLDYFATSKLEPERHSEIVKGIAKGCEIAKCALIGGETAEMPDMYKPGDFDLAGFAVGMIDRGKIIDGHDISANDLLIGISSSGFHSNGFSLVRKVIADNGIALSDGFEDSGRTIGEHLLEPTIIYTQLLSQLTKNFQIKGIAHITGGGFYDNIPRILPKGIAVEVSRSSWDIPPIFRFIQKHGSIDDEELLRVFNCGIGLVLVTTKSDADGVIQNAKAHGMSGYLLGKCGIRRKGDPVITIL